MNNCLLKDTGYHSSAIEMINTNPPAKIYGFLLPNLHLVLSDITPISGSDTASHIFDIIMTVPAHAALIPTTLVKKNKYSIETNVCPPPLKKSAEAKISFFV